MNMRSQAMMIAETYMDHVARAVGKPPAAVRELNMYKEGDRTHFGQLLEGCQVRGLFGALKRLTEHDDPPGCASNFSC